MMVRFICYDQVNTLMFIAVFSNQQSKTGGKYQIGGFDKMTKEYCIKMEFYKNVVINIIKIVINKVR